MQTQLKYFSIVINVIKQKKHGKKSMQSLSKQIQIKYIRFGSQNEAYSF